MPGSRPVSRWMSSAEQQLAQYDGVVVQLIVRGIHQRDRAFAREAAQFLELVRCRRIAAAEFRPARRIAAEPLSMQGYLFSKPVSEPELARLIEAAQS